MSFNLKSFQKNFSDEISSTIESFLQSKKTDNKICIFQSPTGSGKTLMLANAIYNLIKDNENFNVISQLNYGVYEITQENLPHHMYFLWIDLSFTRYQSQTINFRIMDLQHINAHKKITVGLIRSLEIQDE